MSSAQRLKTLLIRLPNTRALTEPNPLGNVWAFQGNYYAIYTDRAQVFAWDLFQYCCLEEESYFNYNIHNDSES